VGAAVFLTAALLASRPATIAAHDPGLSGLDVAIAARAIRVTLTLAPDDARQVSGTIDDLARAAIAVAIDDGPLAAPASVRTDRSDAAVTVTLHFDRAAGSRLRITSDVPRRVAIGHRQLLTVRSPDGHVVAERMLAAHAEPVEVALGSMQPVGGRARSFVALGFRHILGGYDHLLFLIALLLGVRRLRSVIATVTAFTAAHSITLSFAVLGFVAAPPALIEPLIAASIVFVGIENLMRVCSFRLKAEATPVIYGSRWKLSFAFGLVHGFGFAGALRDLSAADQLGSIAIPLGCFNAGVEAGQILVVLTVWPVLRVLNGSTAWSGRLAPATSLGVAAAGCYWLIERIVN